MIDRCSDGFNCRIRNVKREKLLLRIQVRFSSLRKLEDMLEWENDGVCDFCKCLFIFSGFDFQKINIKC